MGGRAGDGKNVNGGRGHEAWALRGGQAFQFRSGRRQCDKNEIVKLNKQERVMGGCCQRIKLGLGWQTTETFGVRKGARVNELRRIRGGFCQIFQIQGTRKTLGERKRRECEQCT